VICFHSLSSIILPEVTGHLCGLTTRVVKITRPSRHARYPIDTMRTEHFTRRIIYNTVHSFPLELTASWSQRVAVCDSASRRPRTPRSISTGSASRAATRARGQFNLPTGLWLWVENDHRLFKCETFRGKRIYCKTRGGPPMQVNKDTRGTGDRSRWSVC